MATDLSEIFRTALDVFSSHYDSLCVYSTHLPPNSQLSNISVRFRPHLYTHSDHWFAFGRSDCCCNL